MPRSALEKFVSIIVAGLVLTAVAAGLSDASADDCKWYGTAPFCATECPGGWKETQRSKTGDGKACVTGQKKLCCRVTAGTGTSTSTSTSGPQNGLLAGLRYIRGRPPKCSNGHELYAGPGRTPVFSVGGILCLINAERTSRGLTALTMNDQLKAAALGHAKEAVRLKWWVGNANSHVNPESGPKDPNEAIGFRIKNAGYCKSGASWSSRENTYHGAGQSKDCFERFGCATPTAAVNWWMNISKSGHRETILDPSLREIGIAAIGDTADPANAPYSPKGLYVVDFGSCK